MSHLEGMIRAVAPFTLFVLFVLVLCLLFGERGARHGQSP